LRQELNRACPRIYNDLPDVERADRMLSDIGRTIVLNALSELVINHGLKEVFGIRLLHNHNRISDHEIMVEQAERDSFGRPCLTTSARLKTEVKAAVHPNSWRTFANHLVPLEFSLDQLVQPNALVEATQFLLEFARLAHDLKVERFIGPAILPRKFYLDYSPPFPSLLLERSDRSRRAKIVRFCPAEQYKSTELIETIWKATIDDESKLQGCSTFCAKGSCVPISACVKDGDDHNEKSTHDEGDHQHLRGEK
jgi:hypothetical protein